MRRRLDWRKSSARLPSVAANVKNAEVLVLVRRVLRVVERVVIGVVVAVAVLVAVAALRLMSGPIDLSLLKPRIAEAIDAQGGKMKIDADRIYVEWSSLKQPIRLVFGGLHVMDSDNKEVATAPSVALSFSPRSVVEGHFFPTSIIVEQPMLDADIAREGGMLRRILAKTDSDSQGEVVALLIEQLLGEPNYHSLLGQLDTVLVERAHVTLRDIPSGVVWTAPSARASLKRDATGVIIAASARFSRGVDGEPIDVSLTGTYARDRSRISVEAKIDGVKPRMFADFSPDVAILDGIDIALSNRLTIEADGKGEIRTVKMEVMGGRGTISLPGILPATHPVRSVNALASVDAAAHTARIEHVDIDLGAARLRITGVGLKTEKGQSFNGRADLRQIPVDRLGDYWPMDLAPGGREWALANLSGGTVDVGAEFAVSAPGNDVSNVAIDRTVAFLEYRGLKVQYMPHMPELEGVSGKARYEGNAMRFDIAGGRSVGLGVTGATIDLTNLTSTSADQIATLHMPITGPAATVMAMLARPKLGLPKDALFDPKRIGGDAAINLDLRFPLLKDLSVKDVAIRAETAVSGMSLKNVMGDVDLTDAVGRIVYADNQLTVAGSGKLDGTPVELSIRELFGPKSPYRQRYDLKGVLPAALMAKAGLPSPEPYVSGPVGTTLSYQTQTNGSSDVTAKLDLKAARLEVAPLGWTKAGGVEASLALGLKLAAGAKLVSADFDGTGGGIAAKGQVLFGDKAIVQQVSLQQFSLGRSDVAFDWKRNATGVDIAVRGRSIELAKVRQALKTREELAAKQSGGAAATAQSDTKLSVNLDQVVVQRGTLGALNGRVEMKGDRVASADVTLGGGRGSAFKVTPGSAGRTVALFVPDFGLLLRESGWLDGLVGGDLSFKGQYDDMLAEPKLSGTTKLGPYRMEKVTPRADVGSLNSTIDGLNRAGNALQQFDGLEAKIVKVRDRVEIVSARTSGNSIGLTTAGFIDLANDTARLRGIVVPGFALNNLLSNVPLLGPLLTGGKDGGLFAISYKLEGPLDDLKSDVNMMSAITPNALRALFSGPVDQTPVQEKERVPP
jgi:hypothetical protein